MKPFKSSWRLGATSFVLPAGVSDNVVFLADKVDDIQLLFFESPGRSRLPHKLDIDFLKTLAREHGLSYSVHLPIDLELNSPSSAARYTSVGEICKVVEEVVELAPLCFDLHLDYYGQGDKTAWLSSVDHSLSILTEELGDLSRRIAVENIDYPFREVRSLVLGHGLSLCLDFGHALLYGDNLTAMIEDIPQAAHIHYHGVEERDHMMVTGKQRDLTVQIGQGMRDSEYRGVFTVEVYEQGALEGSLQELAQAWGRL